MRGFDEKEKMLTVPLYEEKWLWLAQKISRFSNPLYIALPLYLYVALATASTTIQGLLWWAEICIGVSAAPLLFIWRGVRRGQYSDHHVSKREQRVVPFLFSIGCIGIATGVLILLNASKELMGTMVAMLIAIIIAMAITHFARWKISLHLIGITGAITTLATLEPLFVLLSPIIAVVGWSRWMVGAHSPLQACAGFLLGISVIAVVFGIFGIL